MSQRNDTSVARDDFRDIEDHFRVDLIPETARPPLRPFSLFPPSQDRKRFDDFLTQELTRTVERVAEGPVVPTLDLATFKEELADFDFRAPQPLEKLLAWTISSMEHGLVHVTHPRYFGLFNPAPTVPSQCADRIVNAFNPQLATWTTSPIAVEIEAHVIRAVAQRAGFPSDAAGHFTSGGSEANYTSLICALTRANPDFAMSGARAFSGSPTLYVSRESHLAWLKIAHQAGIGRAAVRLIATDGFGRMDSNALRDALSADRASGCVPVMIAATAGTTNAGMIDPLEACADLARIYDAWYHVDAAWGGALIASDHLRRALVGIERADSVTIDAHKWFATTMGCGMFITKHRQVLSSAFQVSTSFMPSNLSDRDPYVTTAQWSRRFMGLRLFMSLAAAGWSGYGQHIERSVALAELLKTKLKEKGWSIVNASPMAVVCINPPAPSSDIKTIVRHVLASGRAWVAAAVFEGVETIRACITNGETTEDDVLELARTLLASKASS
jgi:aromatic-L-amino-acid/L-tryptophan decarboxylase